MVGAVCVPARARAPVRACVCVAGRVEPGPTDERSCQSWWTMTEPHEEIGQPPATPVECSAALRMSLGLPKFADLPSHACVRACVRTGTQGIASFFLSVCRCSLGLSNVAAPLSPTKPNRSFGG